jgi:hypothetical protein
MKVRELTSWETQPLSQLRGRTKAFDLKQERRQSGRPQAENPQDQSQIVVLHTVWIVSLQARYQFSDSGLLTSGPESQRSTER